MPPDDPRHGTRRGYYAHRRAGQDACTACKRAAAAAEAARQLRLMHGHPGRVPAIGTKRRLRALQALGWTLTEIAARLDVPRSRVEKWATEDTTYAHASTALQVARIYKQLCMTLPPPGPWVTRTRNLAQRRGYHPPLAWDDIDHDEQPRGIRTTERRDLLAEWDELREAGESIEQAAIRLGVTVGAIEKAGFRRRAVA